MRRNIATSPELGQMSLGLLSLAWTRHAQERTIQKNVNYVSHMTVSAGDIVELESDGSRVTKVVVRLAGSSRDHVYVLVPKTRTHWLVVTCWTNRKDDTHKTLKLERLSA